MNVLIAKSIEECEQWTEVVVVVDVLRASTTLCALLNRGKKDILVFDDPQKATVFAQAHGDFEVFSEQDLSVPHQDNSPYLASKSNARTPALLVSSIGTKTLLKMRQASLVLTGGFCNFDALAEAVISQNKDVLLIPSSLFGVADEVEDGLCVSALKDYIQGIGNPQDAIIEFNNTMRFGEFMHQGPKTASKDAKLAFKVDGLPVVPQISFSKEGYGVCHVYGTEAPAVWMEKATAPALKEKVTQPNASSEGKSSQSQSEEKTQSVTVPSSGTAPVQQTDSQTLNEPSSVEQKDSKNKCEPSAANTAKKEEGLVKEKLSSATHSATTRLKGFFSNIIQAVKEEKAELERDVFSSSQTSPGRSVEPQSDDLLDKVLKQSQETVSKPAEQPTDKKEVAPQQETPKPSEESEKKSQPTVLTAQQAVVSEGEITFSGKESGFNNEKRKKAIVLFSGGLDSTTCLYWALAHGYECEALTVSYGQRHDREVLAAQMIARNLGVKHHLITLDLPWLDCCSLVDKKQELPDVPVEDIPKEGIPSTYVPGRNLMFLSVAGSLLDAVGATAIIAGPNAIDFSGYPDCTPAFFKAAAEALNRGTKTGVSEGIEVLAPLMRLSKAQIVKLAANLKVPFELTWSCYAGGKKPCGHCDSCKLRAKGFEEAGVHDTALD